MAWFFRSVFIVVALLGHPSLASDCERSLEKEFRAIEIPFEELNLDLAKKELEAAKKSFPADCPEARHRLSLFEARLFMEKGEIANADLAVRELGSVRHRLSEVGQVDLMDLEARIAYHLGQYHRARQGFEGVVSRDLERKQWSSAATVHFAIAASYASEALGVSQRDKVIEKVIVRLRQAEALPEESMIPNFDLLLGRLEGGEQGRGRIEKIRGQLQLAEDKADAESFLARHYAEKGERSLAEKHLLEAEKIAEAELEKNNRWVALHLIADRQLVRRRTLPREAAIADSLRALEEVEEFWQQGDEKIRAGLLSVWTEPFQRHVGLLLEDGDEKEPSRATLSASFEVMERYRARVLEHTLVRSGITEPATTSTPGDLLTRTGAALAEDEALLVYQVAVEKDVFGRFAGGSWLLSVSRQETHAYRLPGRVSLERRIDTYLGLVSGREEEGKAAARLYDDLLRPALDDLPETVTKLILVPDGRLHLLPFSMLRETPEAAPLAARYEISSVPSASLWLGWRSSVEPPPSSNALIFADPWPDGVPASPLRGALGRLPFAKEEGEAIQRRVGGESILRLGAQASETFLKKQRLGEFGILHFATHAVLDEVHPERSAVFLAADDKEDGELRPAEIVGLDLPGTLVVLSACQSASGKLLPGEGVMGLARAFFQAGATTVLGSLWPMDDKEVRHLSEAFYRHLAGGRSARAALRLAQEDLRAEGAPPNAWAGMVVLGDGARSYLPERRSPLVWLVLPAVLLLLLLAWKSWRRRPGHARS